MTRTFKVWDVSTSAFFANISSITNASGTPLPEHGSVFVTTTGPSGTVGADSTPTDMFLWKYTLHPVSAVVFIAVAHYTNDPRQAPNGQDYRSTAQYAMVNIPYARRIPNIVAGMSGSSLLALSEAVLPYRMPIQRIAQTVTIQRSLRPIAESAARDEASKIHNVPGVGYAKFETMDISLRSPQWIDLRYNWTWEQGIKAVFDDSDGQYGVLTQLGSTDTGYPINDAAIYPKGWMQAVDARLGTASRHVLFPYHTIEMTFVSAAGVRTPLWVSRLPYVVNPNGASSLVGAEKFEWNI